MSALWIFRLQLSLYVSSEVGQNCQWLQLITGPSYREVGGSLSHLFFLILTPSLCSVRFPDGAHRFKLLLFGPTPPFSSAANSSAKASEALAIAKRRGAWEVVWCNVFQYAVGRANTALTSTWTNPASWPRSEQTQYNLKIEPGTIAQITESAFLAQGLGNNYFEPVAMARRLCFPRSPNLSVFLGTKHNGKYIPGPLCWPLSFLLSFFF